MIKCIFFGTPDFAAETLEFLVKNKVEVAAVVSRPDRPKGRSGRPAPTAVKLVAEAYGLPVYQPEKASCEEFVETIRQYDADLFIVVAYGEIMRQKLLDVPKLACINVHASLLPKYRGAAPIQRCIIDGEKETGVSIMHMVRRLDAGDVVHQVRVPIGGDLTAGELAGDLRDAGCRALLEVLEKFKLGEAEQTAQDEELVTYAAKLELEDCELALNQPAQVLHNLVRGVNPAPGAWLWVHVKDQKRRLKVMRTRVHSEMQGEVGEIIEYGKKGIVLGTGAGGLEILELQLEGKRRMQGRDFALGTPKNFLRFT